MLGDGDRMKLMLIGDSIRMHYGPWVARELAPDLDVWGPSENCGNSASVLAHIDEWLADQRPDVVHLSCGLHDLRHGAHINDLHGLVVAHGALGLLGPDGVHFTEAGYTFLAGAVAASVRACLGAAAPGEENHGTTEQ